MVLLKSLAITVIIMAPFAPLRVDSLWHTPLTLAVRWVKRRMS
jgi:hypothetical protein